MKKHIITLTGFPGSGKSSTANDLAKALEYKRFSGGDFTRMVAERHGLTLDAFHKLKLDASTKEKRLDLSSLEHEIDEAIRAAGTQEDIVIDSRLAFHWIPSSFKVMLDLNAEIAAHRTFEQIKTEGRLNQTASSEEEVLAKSLKRIESECLRYKTLYNIDYTNKANYDLVVDTGIHNLEETVRLILTEYKNWLTV